MKQENKSVFGLHSARCDFDSSQQWRAAAAAAAEAAAVARITIDTIATTYKFKSSSTCSDARHHSLHSPTVASQTRAAVGLPTIGLCFFLLSSKSAAIDEAIARISADSIATTMFIDQVGERNYAMMFDLEPRWSKGAQIRLKSQILCEPIFDCGICVCTLRLTQSG